MKTEHVNTYDWPYRPDEFQQAMWDLKQVEEAASNGFTYVRGSVALRCNDDGTWTTTAVWEREGGMNATREKVRRGLGEAKDVGQTDVGPTFQELTDWLGEQEWSKFARDLYRFANERGYLTEKQEAAARSMYRKVTARNQARSIADPEEGFYEVDGTIYRVQKGRQSGNLYAKVLDGREWAYVGRQPFAALTTAKRLTVEDAKAHGLAHGWCLRCGRELTVPESVEAGIGPVCAKKWR